MARSPAATRALAHSEVVTTGVRRPAARWLRVVSTLLLVLVAAYGAVRGFGWSADQTLGLMPTMAVISVGSLVLTRRQQRRQERRGVPGLSDEECDLAARASRVGGPVPDDPAVRAQAVRLVRLRGLTSRRSSQVVPAAYGAVGLVALVAGLVGSRWWFVAGVCLVLAAALLAHALRQVQDRLRVLEGSAPSGAEADRTVTLVPEGASPTGLLHIHARKPATWAGQPLGLVLRVDGRDVPATWGTTKVRLGTGRHELDAAADGLGEFGRARLVVQVGGGAGVEVHYSPSVLTFLRGRMGFERQPHPGVVGLVVSTPAVIALIIWLATLVGRAVHG